jgi:indolepyruvate decarboxylase
MQSLAQFANRNLRPIVLVGDGAFQMTCLELSTAMRHGFNPIVVVLNNKGYGTERFLQEGPFNDIPNWQYHRLPELLGGGKGYLIKTEAEFDAALNAAWKEKTGPSILQVVIDQNDCSRALSSLEGSSCGAS